MNSPQITRHDGVLIMARGDSRRMGMPKGMVTLRGEKRTFLEMIVTSYQMFNWPISLIIKPDDETAYQPLLAKFPALSTIYEQGGQDTAQTVLAGWQKTSEKPSHLWVHPVDMPLINQDTLTALHNYSHRYPDNILRPMFQGKPGHPVIIPARCLDILTQENQGPPWLSGPVRSMVQDAVSKKLIQPVLELSLGDPAVTRDFDRIVDL